MNKKIDPAISAAAKALGALGCSRKSKAKTVAARKNGGIRHEKKGGWPKGKPRKPEPVVSPEANAAYIAALDALRCRLHDKKITQWAFWRAQKALWRTLTGAVE